MLVPTIRTVCTPEELCRSIITAWKKLFNNSIPSKKSVCIIMAQHQIETGGNQCWNWNIANCKYVAANGNVDYCALNGVWEMVNGKRVELQPTDPGSWFRSFPTLDDGAVFYLEFISGSRYESAWKAVQAGDPAQFSHLLKVHGYYTADETQYTAGLVAHFNVFMKMTTYEQVVIPRPSIPSVVPPPVEPVVPPPLPDPTLPIPSLPSIDVVLDPEPNIVITPDTPIPPPPPLPKIQNGSGLGQLVQGLLSFLASLFKKS